MSIVLTRNGTAVRKIRLPGKAGRVMRFAASELQKYLQKMTGCVFPEAEEPKGSAITLTSDDTDGPDRFRIVCGEEEILLHGSNERSVLYAVYEFLEHLGCRFAEPGVETIPCVPDLEISAFQTEQTASFPLRSIFRIQVFQDKTKSYRGLDDFHLPQIDWMAKRKLNHYVFYVDYARFDLWERYKHKVLGALLDRGFTIELSHHSCDYFCPRDVCRDYGNWGDETYYLKHPDWYERFQIHIEREDVQRIMFTRLLTFAERNPELEILSLWPGDSKMEPIYPGMTVTDSYLTFWNRAARELGRAFPGKRLSICAYLDLLDAPVNVAPEQNLHIWFCPISSNYMYPLMNGRNRKFAEKLEKWCLAFTPGNIATFEYYGWQPILTPFTKKMRKDLAYYRTLKLAGTYAWCGFTYNLMGQDFRWARDLHIMADLLWNADVSVEDSGHRWAEAVYGKAAGGIDVFYHLIQKRFEVEQTRELVGFMRAPQWIPLDTLHEGQKILAEARTRAEDGYARKRIDMLEALICNGANSKIWRRMPDEVEAIF